MNKENLKDRLYINIRDSNLTVDEIKELSDDILNIAIYRIKKDIKHRVKSTPSKGKKKGAKKKC